MNLRIDTTFPLKRLGDLLALNDSGTWGDEPNGESSLPVLRSTNIVDGYLDLSEPAWRKIPPSDLKRKDLSDGDIIVTKSSGSKNHIGKCCLFFQPPDNVPYFFSNFTFRLRANSRKADPRWLYYWLNSKFGKEIVKVLNSTTSGLRNLDVNRYLDQFIPAPEPREQRRIAAILDKADAIRRKRRQALAEIDTLLRSVFLDMFGVNERLKTIPLKEFAEVQIGYPFESSKYIKKGIKLCRGVNVLPLRIDWSDVQFWPESESGHLKQYFLDADDVILALDRPWISNGAKVVQIKQDDLPSLLVQRVAQVRGENRASSNYIYQQFRSPRFWNYFRPTETTIPHISPVDLRNYPIAVPGSDNLRKFGVLSEVTSKSTFYLKMLAYEADIMFASLSQRAFRGEL